MAEEKCSLSSELSPENGEDGGSTRPGHSMTRTMLTVLQKGLPIMIVQFLVVLSLISVLAEKGLLKNVNTQMNLKSSRVSYELDQCMDLSPEEKDDRAACCANDELPVLGGIDVVQLFSQPAGSLPTLGTPAFTADLQTSTGEYSFYFSSSKNLEKFKQDPWAYAPAFGGFCACGLALEERFSDPSYGPKLGPYIDVSKWTIVNERLYFFSGPGPLANFEAAGAEGRALGDAHWAAYYGGAGHLRDGAFNTNCFHRQAYRDLALGVPNEFQCPAREVKEGKKGPVCGC